MSQLTLHSSIMLFNSIYASLQLISSHDWETFRSAILSRPALFRELARDVSLCSQLHGMTLLHAAVRYDSPLEVIVEMIRLCPGMPAAKDCLGRTPLHVAAGLKASASLLTILAHACPAACIVQDEGGKTPLHFLCDSSCVLFEEDHHNDSKRPPDHDAVVALLSYSIHAATLEDDEEMSPLEHSIISGASLKTVKLLQSATSNGTQLSHLRSFTTSTTSLQPKVECVSSSVSTERPLKRCRRISAYQEDLKNSIV
jgi:ankyrin repeat protein